MIKQKDREQFFFYIQRVTIIISPKEIRLKGFLFIVFWFVSGCIELQAQINQPEWLAKNCVFPQLEYDLLEVQPYAGIFYLHSNKIDLNAAYIPVNIGFRKSIVQWPMFSATFDLAMGAASYTQFEIAKFDENTFRGGLLNTDFKASGFLNMEKDQHKLRFQFFHISSHLGDDYILRNQDYELNDKSVNYEQIDLTYLYNLKTAEIYGGLGYVITPNVYRKRWMIEVGMQSNISIKSKLDLIAGADIKLYEENNYSPDIHAGLGICVKQRESRQISFLLDFFIGQLPNSTLDYGQVFWIGPSCTIFI